MHATNANITGTINAGSVLVGANAGSSAISKIGGIYVINYPSGVTLNTSNCVLGSSGINHSGITLSNGGAAFTIVGNGSAGVYLRPGGGTKSSGLLNGTWVLDNGNSVTSDQRCKNTIQSLSEKYSLLFDGLIARTYKYNNGTSGRKHIGFIAQEVEDAIKKADLTSKDAALVLDVDDGNGGLMKTLRYEEIIGLLVQEVQSLKETVRSITYGIQ